MSLSGPEFISCEYVTQNNSGIVNHISCLVWIALQIDNTLSQQGTVTRWIIVFLFFFRIPDELAPLKNDFFFCSFCSCTCGLWLWKLPSHSLFSQLHESLMFRWSFVTSQTQRKLVEAASGGSSRGGVETLHTDVGNGLEEETVGLWQRPPEE